MQSIVVERILAVLEINNRKPPLTMPLNTHSHSLMSLSYFPHKTRLITVAAGCHMDNPPLIPPQP